MPLASHHLSYPLFSPLSMCSHCDLWHGWHRTFRIIPHQSSRVPESSLCEGLSDETPKYQDPSIILVDTRHTPEERVGVFQARISDSAVILLSPTLRCSEIDVKVSFVTLSALKRLYIYMKYQPQVLDICPPKCQPFRHVGMSRNVYLSKESHRPFSQMIEALELFWIGYYSGKNVLLTSQNILPFFSQ